MTGCAFGCEVSIVYQEPRTEYVDVNGVKVSFILLVNVCSVCGRAWIDPDTYSLHRQEAIQKHLETNPPSTENKDIDKG